MATVLKGACPLPYTCKTYLATIITSLLLGLPSALAQEVADSDADVTPEGEWRLAPVMVSAAAIKDGTTEGTGSFTADNTNAATGMDLSLRETPQSVTVITRERLDQEGISSLGEAVARAPGITFRGAGSALGSYAGISSRGYSVNSLMLDGLPLPTAGVAGYSASQGLGTLNTDLYDAVTVVRGATGLMTGAGNPSATISLTRKRPTHDFQASVSQTLGTWDLSRTVGDIAGPLNSDGTFRGRIVGVKEIGDSWKQGYNYEKAVLYGVVEADVTEQTVARVALEYGENQADGGAGPYTGYALADKDGKLTPFGRGDNSMADWSGFEDSRLGLSAALDHHLNDDWKMSVSYNHNTIETKQRFGLASYIPDANGEADIHLRSYRIDNTVDSVGAKLDGSFALLGREHDLSVGLNGSWTDDYTKDFYRDRNGFKVNVYDWNRHFPEPDWESLYGFGSRNKIEENGAYVATRLSATDDLSLLLGARWSNWRTRALDENGNEKEKREEKGVITPYVGLVYDVTPNISAYASYTTIFNPQSRRDVNDQLLDPEEGINLETGLKGEWFNGRLNASAAVFEVEKDNLSVKDGTNQTPQGNQAYRAEDQTKGRGWELEIAGELMPGWQVQGGYTRMLTQDNEGARLNTDQAKHQVKLFTSYTPESLSQLTLGGGVNWQSHTYMSGAKDLYRDIYTQDSYWVSNLMARYEFNEQLSLTANVNNLFDEAYRIDLDIHDYGAPRNVQATLKYQF
ncbi:TonB-dependent siderophore receptor [Oceanisphaera avium]|uniref:TonB-dependent siderophore receptor n=1 Tax=Oceanisphaera avium TaxID=1903694 RepID=A0A1Y0CWG6_9GAMM|nr:TonB-dependent siderophore receptor [Oceanisphaera avium]ART79681.1 hypothetical protein CBP12_05545 [Oceanisphaera avium]